MEIST